MDSGDDNHRQERAERQTHSWPPLLYCCCYGGISIQQPLMNHLSRVQLCVITRTNDRADHPERKNFISIKIIHADWRLSEINPKHDQADGGIFAASAIQHRETNSSFFTGDIPRRHCPPRGSVKVRPCRPHMDIISPRLHSDLVQTRRSPRCLH